jgi:hypothetical protein
MLAICDNTDEGTISAKQLGMTCVISNLIRVRSASQSLGSVGDCGDFRNPGRA